MRAFVLTAPGAYEVQDLPAPVAAPGEVVVDVERVGVCGTDMEFFTGAMAYLHRGHSSYPMRPGHEWAGRVATVGEGVDPAWTGRRVMGDTMLGCGNCRRCLRGHQHVCEKRQEVGIRGARPGALAEQLAVPAFSLHALPDSVDAVLGALVEPGGNALRAAQAAAVRSGGRALVVGPGTIGLLVAMFLRAAGAEVHLLDRPGHSPRSPTPWASNTYGTSGLCRTCPSTRSSMPRTRPICRRKHWSWSNRPAGSCTSGWPVSRAGSTLARSCSRT